MRPRGIRHGRQYRTTSRRTTVFISVVLACFLFGGVSTARAQTSTTTFSYSLVSGGPKTILAGSSTSQVVTATWLSGTAQALTFTVTGLPVGASLAFPSCIVTCASAAMITTSPQTPLGVYTISVTGTPSATTTTFLLTITATTSLSGTVITPGSGTIVDSLGALWTLLASGAVKRNGEAPTNPDFAPQTISMLYWNGSVYQESVYHTWRRWDTTGRSLADPNNWVSSTNPRASTTTTVALLTSSHAKVVPGLVFSLSWSSVGAQGCTGDTFPTGFTATGTLKVSISATTTFSIRCGTASATTTVGIQSPAAVVPTVPSGLEAKIENAHVRLSWNPSFDELGVVGYEVYRDGQRIGSTLMGSTTALDTRATPGAMHTYTVAAYNASGNMSARSAGAAIFLASPPPTPAETNTTQSIAALQARIQELLATIQTLEAAVAKINTAPSASAFTRDLDIGSEGEDVRRLQQFLNREGFTVAVSGAGSPGYETTTFGPRTQAALALWQSSVGIYPAQGYFGPKTRMFIAVQL